MVMMMIGDVVSGCCMSVELGSGVKWLCIVMLKFFCVMLMSWLFV